MKMVIKNLKKAANRISKAIKSKEKIILYGDADLDGASSVIILKEAISSLGGEVSEIYFPDREIEGYGITTTALKHLKQFAPALLIAVDCGIGNVKEVKIAKKLGFSVIIIDHHKILGKIPQADIVVDPLQKGDNYPFKGFSATGLVFKTVEALIGDKMSENLRGSFLQLVALATIADMMPKVEDNKVYIEEGLMYLKSSWRPGIKLFLEANFLKGYPIQEKVSRMISMMNIRDVEDKFPTSFRVLTAADSKELEDMIWDLKEKTEIKRERIREMAQEAEERIMKKEEAIIFEGDESWDYPLISAVASIAVRNFGKPSFIFKKMKKESQGTVRVPEGVDSVVLMGKCKDLVITYGGHPKASGFRIKNKNLKKFKACLIKEYEKDKDIH